MFHLNSGIFNLNMTYTPFLSFCHRKYFPLFLLHLLGTRLTHKTIPKALDTTSKFQFLGVTYYIRAVTMSPAPAPLKSHISTHLKTHDLQGHAAENQAKM